MKISSLGIALFISQVFLHMALAQTQPPGIPTMNIFPPRPETKMFQRYGDYPVDFSTGIPQISIPVYEISSGKLKLPITLTYHASGFKPSDPSGLVGLGWSLNTGGLISRTVQSDPDELCQIANPGKPANQIDVFNSTDTNYLGQLEASYENGGKDLEADIFYYSAGNLSGKFFLKNIGNSQLVPSSSPYNPVRISCNSATFQGPIDTFTLTDDNGITYIYTEIEKSIRRHTSSWITNAWKISKMISYDKSDTILFEYIDSGGPVEGRQDYYTIDDQVQVVTSQSGCGNGYGYNCSHALPAGGVFFDQRTYTNHYGRAISSIKFKYGKLVFEYNTTSSIPMILDRIKLYNDSGVLQRTFQFNHSYYTGSTEFYKLDEIQTLDMSGNLMERFGFLYNGGSYQRYNYLNASTSMIDWWGYYNGASSNENLLPSWTIVESTYGHQITIGNANREANENYMKSFMLNTITYPTGGYTVFDYEGNKALMPDGTLNGTVKIIGGLRIKTITSFPGDGTQVKKTYKYGNLSSSIENGIGDLMYDPTQMANHMLETTRVVYCTSCGSVPGPVDFYSVTRTITSDMIDGTGSFESSPIFYPYVTEYIGDTNSNIGKTIYTFDSPTNLYLSDPLNSHIRVVLDWQGRNNLSKEIYKSAGNNQYTLIQKEVYDYQKKQTDVINCMRVFSGITGLSTNSSDSPSPPGVILNLAQYALSTIGNPVRGYRYFDYYILCGISRLQSEVITNNADQANPVVTTRLYQYGSYHNKPISIVETTSEGKSRITDIQYPTEANFYSGSYLSSNNLLVSSNNISRVAQTKLSVDGVTTQLTNNYYKDWGNGLPQLEKTDVQNGSVPLETRMQFTYDLNGNIVSYLKPSDIPTSVVWGYKNSLPIAKVENADATSIAYTGFEDSGTGNWNSNVITFGSGFTGNRGGILSAGKTISKSGLDNTKSFTVSLWGQAGASIQMNGVSVSSSFSRNGWSYFEQSFSNTSQVTISGSGVVDELRLFPKGALMTTYVYDPLKGISTLTDTNNNTTFFEYDGLGRLINEKDQYGNITRQINYHYKGIK